MITVGTHRETGIEHHTAELAAYLQALSRLDVNEFALLSGASQKAAWAETSTTAESVQLATEIARETGRDRLLVQSYEPLSAGMLAQDRHTALWASHAALAIVIRDFITAEHFNHLTGPVRAAKIDFDQLLPQN